MSLVVNQRPSVNWVASSNPILYKMTRKDYAWTGLINDGAGRIKFSVAGDITATNAVNDFTWIQSDDGAYSIFGGFIFSISFAAGTTTVVLSQAYVANNAAGYFNNTTQRKNYYVSVGIWSFIGGVGALMTTMIYTPNNKGDVNIDVAQSVNANMNPNYPGIPVFPAITGQDANAKLTFYIKILEVWTGSANVEFDDVANKFNAVFAALQIPSSSNAMDQYLQNVVAPFSRLRAAFNEFFAISVIDWTASANAYIRMSLYDAADTLICKYFANSPLPIPNNKFLYLTTKLDKNNPRFLFPNTFPDRNFGAGTSWTLNVATIMLAAGATSKLGAVPFFVPSGGNNVSVSFSTSSGGMPFTLDAILLDANGAPLSTTNLFTNIGGFQVGVKPLTAPGADAYFIAYRAINLGGGVGTLATANGNQFVFRTPNVITKLSFDFLNTGAGIFTESANGAVTFMDFFDADNPVTLFWRNNSGGLSSWTFNYNQDKSFTQSQGMKAKRLTLYTNGLSQNQWDCLNELNSMGEVYQPAIIELTAAVIGTTVRRGAQVYLINSARLATGQIDGAVAVTVIPSVSKTKSRKLYNELDITIELPEYIQQR